MYVSRYCCEGMLAVFCVAKILCAFVLSACRGGRLAVDFLFNRKFLQSSDEFGSIASKLDRGCPRKLGINSHSHGCQA